MKKRKNVLTALLLAVSMVLGLSPIPKVMAADDDLGKIIDGSMLTENEESIGEIDQDTIIYVGNDDDDNENVGIVPYGTYLLTGSSKISNAGNGKIIASGETSAHKKTSLKVVVTVDRYSGGTWNYITSWSATKSNATTLMTTKTLSVTKGYFYRVRCSHAAGGETGYSYTDGIKIS